MFVMASPNLSALENDLVNIHVNPFLTKPLAESVAPSFTAFCKDSPRVFPLSDFGEEFRASNACDVRQYPLNPSVILLISLGCIIYPETCSQLTVASNSFLVFLSSLVIAWMASKSSQLTFKPAISLVRIVVGIGNSLYSLANILAVYSLNNSMLSPFKISSFVLSSFGCGKQMISGQRNLPKQKRALI